MQKKWYDERIARGGIGQAGAELSPFHLWLDDWSWRSETADPFPGTISAVAKDFSFHVDLRSMSPIITHGDNGYSKKHGEKDIASYYYSAPYLKIKGSLELGDRTVNVTGRGWFDREWSSSFLDKSQQGWDWFAFHLDNQQTLMIAQVRDQSKKGKDHQFGSLMNIDGSVISLTSDDIQLKVLREGDGGENKDVPLEWQIVVKKYDINIMTTPLSDTQWLPFLIPYWEGPISFSGTHNGKCFMELTGY